MFIGDWSGKGAQYYGQREALFEVATGQRLTYAQLDRRAQGLAACLGVHKGDRVGVLAHNNVQTLDVFFACGKLGAIFVPFNWRLHAKELQTLSASITPKVLLYTEEHAAMAQAMASACGARLVAMQSNVYEAMLAAAPTLPTATAPEDIACFIFTGGTTGLPKAAQLSHRMLAANCTNTIIHEAIPGDVTITHTPLFHTGGMFVHTLPILVGGGRVVLMRQWNADDAIRLIAQERVTVFFCVPSQYVAMLQSPLLATADFSHVRYMTSGGAPLPVEVQKEFAALHSTPFKQGFGMTEFGPGAMTLAPEDADAHVGSVGRPNYFVEAKVDAAPGEVGELCLRGPALFSGYFGSSEPFVDDEGWFHTGDLARCDAQNFYTIVGRQKDMYISGGENIYPVELENVLYQHHAVAQCAVVGMPDPKWGEVGHAFVVLKPGASASSDELLAFLGAAIARFKLPKKVSIVDALPLSAAGKILKTELRTRPA